MIEKFVLSVLVGETLTSEVKGKAIGCRKRKKVETLRTTISTSSVLVTPKGEGKRNRKRAW